MVLGPNLNRPARESIQLRASRARERDKRDDGVAVRHASELSVLSTHRAEGLAATTRGRKSWCWALAGSALPARATVSTPFASESIVLASHVGWGLAGCCTWAQDADGAPTVALRLRIKLEPCVFERGRLPPTQVQARSSLYSLLASRRRCRGCYLACLLVGLSVSSVHTLRL